MSRRASPSLRLRERSSRPRSTPSPLPPLLRPLRPSRPNPVSPARPARAGGSGASRSERNRMRQTPPGWSGSSQHEFDGEAAEIYLGKYILIGVTFVDPAGQVEDSVQMHGVVESASRDG